MTCAGLNLLKHVINVKHSGEAIPDEKMMKNVVCQAILVRLVRNLQVASDHESLVNFGVSQTQMKLI